MLWRGPLLRGLLTVLIGGFTWRKWVGPRLRLGAMRFFRNLSRWKSHQRLYGTTAQSSSLVPFLIGTEDLPNYASPFELATRGSTTDEEDSDAVFAWIDEDISTMTLEDLWDMRGEEGSPLYLSLKGRVYDVSAAADRYGKGKAYHKFVGTDASLAFAKGCMSDECFTSATSNRDRPSSQEELVKQWSTLSLNERRELNRWVDLYEKHDKYTFVGTLRLDSEVDRLVQQILDDDLASDTADKLAERTEAAAAALADLFGDDVFSTEESSKNTETIKTPTVMTLEL